MKYAIANWKMNLTAKEGLRLAQVIKSGTTSVPGTKVILCPPFIALDVLASLFEVSEIELGAQNMHYETEGAYTGEISPLMLKDYASYVILGHSERRTYFHETNDIVNRKIRAAITNGLKPILCVGENYETYKAKETFTFLDKQLKESLAGIDPASLNKLIIAYEPIWAIGSGETPDKNEIENVAKFIEVTLEKHFETDTVKQIPLLYGGSVTAFNVLDFVSLPHISGVLVGGASLQGEEFTQIISRIQSLT